MEQTSLSHRLKSRSVSREYIQDDTDYQVDLKRHSSNSSVPPRKEKSNGIRGFIRNIMPKGKQNEAFTPKSKLPESIDDVRKLISLYRQFDSLYNPRNPQYERKGADKIYYSEIASHFPGTTPREIQEFIKELRMIFEQEHWAIENARSLYGEILKPSIEYFNDFLFLLPYMYEDESLKDFQSEVEIGRNSFQANEVLDQTKDVSTPPNNSYVVLDEDFGSSIVSEQPSLRTHLTDYKDDAYDKYITHTPITGNPFCGFKKRKDKQLDLPKQDKKLEELGRQKQELEKKKFKDQEKKKIVELERKRLEEEYKLAKSQERRPVQTRPNQNREEPVRVNQTVPPPKQSNIKKDPRRPVWPNDECNVCKMPMRQDGSNHSGKPTHQQQVDAFCDMMRCELGSAPEQVFNNAKWRIIEVLRDVQRPNNVKLQGGPVPKKCHCPARFKDPAHPSVCRKICPFCSKSPKKND